MAAAEFILACFKSKTREKICISSAATKNGKEVSLLWKMQYGDVLHVRQAFFWTFICQSLQTRKLKRQKLGYADNETLPSVLVSLFIQ